MKKPKNIKLKVKLNPYPLCFDSSCNVIEETQKDDSRCYLETTQEYVESMLKQKKVKQSIIPGEEHIYIVC
jgi:hypothetical protein